MTLAKNYNLRGMNNRTRGFGTDLTWANRIQNMEQDSKGAWNTRKGSQTVGTGTVVDQSFYQKASEMIYLTPTGPAKRVGAALVAANGGGIGPAANWSQAVSFGEYGGVLYWADPSGLNDIWKYDGYMHYRAGVIPPTVAALGAGAVYYRTVLAYMDLQGNITWGDYDEQTGPVNATAVINTLNGTQYWAKHGFWDVVTTFTGTGGTFAVQAGHNYVAGDYIMVRPSLIPVGIQRRSYVVRIGAVPTPTSITLDPFTTEDPTITFPTTTGVPIEDRLYAFVFSSANATFGYTLTGYAPVNTNAATISIISGTTFYLIVQPTFPVPSPLTPIEDVYDTTDIKGIPPRWKYITFYRNQMVGANKSAVTATSNFQNYPSTFGWSNLLIGSSVETFAPFDETQVGKTNEGAITGLFGGDLALSVLKEKQVYFISGILFGQQFIPVSAHTNGIGCVSHKSITEIQGGCAFMSQRGMYITAGQQVQELSDIIEPFLLSSSFTLDLTGAKSISIPIREKIYIFIPAASSANDVIMVYDYYWKNWSYHYGRSARNGFAILANELSWTDGTNIKAEQAAYSDSGVAINAFWESENVDFGDAMLKKKFVTLVLVSVCQAAWNAEIKTFINWDESTVKTDTTDAITVASPYRLIPLSVNKAYSCMTRIGCNTINQAAVITAIGMAYDNIQKDVMGGV